ACLGHTLGLCYPCLHDLKFCILGTSTTSSDFPTLGPSVAIYSSLFRVSSSQALFPSPPHNKYSWRF
ncbi:hypothetical protein FA13DRAFT_1725453, partial [Coprinellus micaceus]